MVVAGGERGGLRQSGVFISPKVQSHFSNCSKIRKFVNKFF
jgi:hypothetical protein